MPKSNIDIRVISEWTRWAIVILLSVSAFYLRSTFVSKEQYIVDRSQDRREYDTARKVDLDRFEVLERERSLRLDRLNSTLQDLALSIRTVQADKTPVYLAERIQVLERDLNDARKSLQELYGTVGVIKQQQSNR